MARVTSANGGVAALNVRPTLNTDYYAAVVGDALYTTSSTPAKLISVRTLVAAKVSATSIKLGATSNLTGSVGPSHAGQAVTIQRYYGSAWHNVINRTLTSSSAFSYPVKPAMRGTYTFRAYKAADTDHLASYSGNVVLRVVYRLGLPIFSSGHPVSRS